MDSENDSKLFKVYLRSYKSKF